MNESNETIRGKVVVITGASSGLGESMARHLAARGAKLVLGARREERLQKLADEINKGGEAIWQTTDVTRRDQVEALAAAAKERFGRIDVMVNNAGLMPLSPLDSLKVDEWEQMVDVNIKGVMYGIAAVLPAMREQKSGHVINLSSVAGHKLFPGAAVYCATKFAVRALSEGLRMEAGNEIRCTNISPGAVATELTSTITDENAKQAADDLYEIAIGPDAVARAVVYAIEQPADVDINEIILRPTAQEL